MDFFDILLAKKLEDDRDPKVEGLSVTQNGRYHEDGVVYDPVIVEVPETTLTTLNATENRTYTAPSGIAYNEVDVDVPLPENAYLLKELSNLPQPIATFNDGSDLPLKSLTASIEPVQSGSGDPSPTNVRPITGWTGCEVIDDAVYGGFIDWNQLTHNGDFSDGVNDWTALNNNTQLSANDGVLQVDGSSGRRSYGFYQDGNLVNDHIVLVSSRLKFGKIGGSTEKHELIMYVNNSWIPTRINDTTDWFYLDKMFIVEENTTRIGIRHYNLDPAQDIPIIQCDYFKTIDLTQLFGETKANEIYAMEQAETGSGVAYFKSLFYKDYYPYNSGEITNVSAVNGDTDKYRKYTIPFTDSQGNPVEVYGGSVDVTGGNVNVTHYCNKVTSVTRSTSTSFYRNTTTAKGSQYGSRVMCDKFVSANSSSDVGVFINSSGAVRFNTKKEYASASEFLADYGGEINVVYERETPYDLILQPTPIKSLDGENNVFASTGDVEELKYFTKATS